MAFPASRPSPTHVLAHLSDTHILSGDGLLAGHIDTVAQLRQTLAKVEASQEAFDALVVSGDLTDSADPAAYELFRSIIEPAAARLGAALVLTGGNHDERRALARGLYDRDTAEPQDSVTEVRGLRIIDMDSALPGRHDGGFSDTQYAWLTKELASTALHGTILVMHHPPITYRSNLMQLLDFDDVDRLRATLTGTDVRAILSGHLHVTTFGTVPGSAIPVLVAGGVSYVDDAGAPRDVMMGLDGPQSWSIVEVHADHVVSTVAPAQAHKTWPALSQDVVDYMAAVPAGDRRTVFATKR